MEQEKLLIDIWGECNTREEWMKIANEYRKSEYGGIQHKAESIDEILSKTDDALVEQGYAFTQPNVLSKVTHYAEPATPPLEGKRVVIVCDNVTLAELFDMQDLMWERYVPGDFLHIVEEITDVTLTPDQMLHQEKMSDIFSGRK